MNINVLFDCDSLSVNLRSKCDGEIFVVVVVLMYIFGLPSQKHKKFSLYQPCKSSFPREIQHLETPGFSTLAKTTPASSPHIKERQPCSPGLDSQAQY